MKLLQITDSEKLSVVINGVSFYVGGVHNVHFVGDTNEVLFINRTNDVHCVFTCSKSELVQKATEQGNLNGLYFFEDVWFDLKGGNDLLVWVNDSDKRCGMYRYTSADLCCEAVRFGKLGSDLYIVPYF